MVEVWLWFLNQVFCHHLVLGLFWGQCYVSLSQSWGGGDSLQIGHNSNCYIHHLWNSCRFIHILMCCCTCIWSLGWLSLQVTCSHLTLSLSLTVLGAVNWLCLRQPRPHEPSSRKGVYLNLGGDGEWWMQKDVCKVCTVMCTLEYYTPPYSHSVVQKSPDHQLLSPPYHTILKQWRTKYSTYCKWRWVEAVKSWKRM